MLQNITNLLDSLQTVKVKKNLRKVWKQFQIKGEWGLNVMSDPDLDSGPEKKDIRRTAGKIWIIRL